MEKEDASDLSYRIIGAAIEVHKILGPGLLESAYESCLASEFHEKRIKFQKQVSLPIHYKGKILNSEYRIDFLVDDLIIIELKSVEKILPVHEAQLMTYLNLSNRKLGLIINFNVPVLKDGINRKVM